MRHSRSEDALLGQAREQLLERHEHRAVGDQVQQEPVEPEERPVAQLAVERHARAAEQRRDQGARSPPGPAASRGAGAPESTPSRNALTSTRWSSARTYGTGYSARTSGMGEQARVVEQSTAPRPTAPSAVASTPESQPEPKRVGSLIAARRATCRARVVARNEAGDARDGLARRAEEAEPIERAVAPAGGDAARVNGGVWWLWCALSREDPAAPLGSQATTEAAACAPTGAPGFGRVGRAGTPR